MKEFLEPIANAFANVEQHDLRVTEVMLTSRKYHELIAHPRIQEHLYINFDTIGDKSIDDHSELRPGPPRPVGGRNDYHITGAWPTQLWGANLIIGKECKVISEEIKSFSRLRIPTYPHELQVTPLSSNYPRREAKIRFAIAKIGAIIIKSRAQPLYDIKSNEWTAIETLREMVTEMEFRRFLKYGFITVKGKSGNIYQIFRDKAHTKVWQNGKVIEEICVRLRDWMIPRTDNLIAFKIMIETDEEEFRKSGNVYKMVA